MMQSLAISAGPENPERHPAFEPCDYIPLIQRTMTERGLHIRELALKTGISKSRLGLLLHRNAAKRPNISLVEFRKILNALDISIMQAIISVETAIDETAVHDERFATLLSMLSELFSGLPAMLIQALDEIDGIDGTEIRREWADPLKEAVVEKLVKEVTRIMARRAVLTETSSIGL
jgi:transcriptional regulator with XRE-family HTH domain